MNLLVICGSIRVSSSNHKLLKAVRKLLPIATSWNSFEIKELPYFDPDLQFSENSAETVKKFRVLAAAADYILIATPEYAHGIPGILKNSLEWLLCEETMKKKVALLIGAPSGGEYVLQHLVETIKTMDLLADQERTLIVRTARTQISSDGEVLNDSLLKELKEFIQQFSKV
jgi:chromate reductase, NAD(P)H dehydrogenase (quinone)